MGPIKGSSTCIVIFSKASEAANCIHLFESHDKVRVTRPDQRDWNQCTDPIPMDNDHHSPSIHNKSNNQNKEKFAIQNAAINQKIANYEEQSSRISIMYKQRHEHQMLFENDQIETRKRLKNNELLISRIEVMYKTSEELYLYLRKMIDLEVK